MRSPGSPGTSRSKTSRRTVQREPSDDYEDYEGQYEYPKPDGLQQKMEDLQLDHDEVFPDMTMLDSVILPAIASVSAFFFLIGSILIAYTYCAVVPPSVHSRSASSA